MIDYNLDALPPRLFEQLVQDLALNAVSDRLVPFNSRSDGVRLATFDGPTRYAPASETWSGYGVIRAVIQDTQDGLPDVKWAQAVLSLSKELTELRAGTATRLPEYYIIATNASQSSPASQDAMHHITSILHHLCSNGDIKGFDTWDYDKIRILLDSHEDVRSTYAAWILPGDVLTGLASSLKHLRSDYYKVLCTFLQKDAIADRYAKLEQAGHSADESIPLSQVFVDLPVAVEPVRETEDGPRTARHETCDFAATELISANLW